MVNAFKAANCKEKSNISMRKSAKQMRSVPFMITYLMHSISMTMSANKDETKMDSDEDEISCSTFYTESNTLENVCNNSLYSIQSILLGHSQKKQRLEQALPVITGLLQSRLHPSHARRIQILLDSRSHGTKNDLINSEIQSFNLTSRQVIAR
jgi:hypothetical protein